MTRPATLALALVATVFAVDLCLPLGVASKRKVGGRRNVDMEVMYPAELPDDVVDRVLGYNARVVEALGLTFGATHGEYLVTADGTPYLIEIANRGGGVYTAPVIVPFPLSVISRDFLMLAEISLP